MPISSFCFRHGFDSSYSSGQIRTVKGSIHLVPGVVCASYFESVHWSSTPSPRQLWSDFLVKSRPYGTSSRFHGRNSGTLYGIQYAVYSIIASIREEKQIALTGI